MMVEVNQLICDNYGKTENGEPTYFRLPEGWYLLVYQCRSFAGYDDWRVTHHFCSSECMDAAVKVGPPDDTIQEG